MLRLIERFLREDDGMELLEWAVVAVLFALAGAAAMSSISSNLTLPVNSIVSLLASGS